MELAMKFMFCCVFLVFLVSCGQDPIGVPAGGVSRAIKKTILTGKGSYNRNMTLKDLVTMEELRFESKKEFGFGNKNPKQLGLEGLTFKELGLENKTLKEFGFKNKTLKKFGFKNKTINELGFENKTLKELGLENVAFKELGLEDKILRELELDHEALMDLHGPDEIEAIYKIRELKHRRHEQFIHNSTPAGGRRRR